MEMKRLLLIFVKSYAVGRIGYGFLMGNDEFKSGGDLKGGLYYGLGARRRSPENTAH
jgi:hypothetical protein